MANDTNQTNADAQPEAVASSGQYAPKALKQNATAPNGKGADVSLDLVLDVPVNVSLRAGSTQIAIRDLVRLVEGSVIALDQDASTPMDVLVNGTLIAHGEIVVVDDRFGVRLTDVVSPVERIQKIG
jgi:flagellar motor switch protein FliN/FliY